MHVLATELATLEEADVAVDLGQSPAEIVVLSFSDSDLSALAAAWQQDADVLPTMRLASLKRLRHPMSVDLYVESVVAQARIVIVRCLGGLDYWRYGFERIADIAREQRRAVRRPAGRRSRRSAARLGLDPGRRAAGAGSTASSAKAARENLRQALRYVGDAAGPRPRLDAAGAGRPDRGCSGEAPRRGRPVALVVFYRANLMAADIAPITALMEALDRQGLAPLGVAVNSLKDPPVRARAGSADRGAQARDHPQHHGLLGAGASDDTTVLDAADVPVLQVVLSGSAREAWAELGARPLARRPRHERRPAGARRSSADARHLLQGRGAGRSAARVRQRAS